MSRAQSLQRCFILLLLPLRLLLLLPAHSGRRGGGWGGAGEEARDQWVLARLEREREVRGAGWGAWKRPMGWAGVEGAV